MNYYVHKNGEMLLLSSMEVEQIRKDKSSFDLWIDLESRESVALGEDLKLFSKRLLLRLLCFLIMKVERGFTAEELFPPVWCMNITDFSEERSVKTAISRLRSLLKDDPKEWKIIKKTEPSIIGRRGEYYFNPEINYCLIRPERFQLFGM